MKIKTIIFFFCLLVLVLAQADAEENGEGGGDVINPGNTGAGGEKGDDKNTKVVDPNNGNGGGNETPGNTGGNVPGNNTSDPKQVTSNPTAKQTVEPAAKTTPGAVLTQPATTIPNLVTAVKTVAKAATQVAKPVTSKAAIPTPPPSMDFNKSNGTPVPEINANRDTELRHSEPSTNWGNVFLIVGGIIGGLFVVGIVFNIINKKKDNSDPINDINFVVNDPPPEPESTCMFTQSNDMYGGQAAGYNDYDIQYGQYGAAPDNQYNQPAAADPYGQGGYPPQEVNYAQRTLSLNRNPAANNQAYQTDENAREVIYNHRPEAGDEIELRRGDQATIYEKYEDGWAWGYNITTGKTGMFPQQCLA